MNKRIYVGNLPFSTTESDLESMFAQHGAVSFVRVITDRETGRSRGFAFVEMGDPTAADEAIRALNGRDMGGRPLRVNEAREREGGGGGGGRRRRHATRSGRRRWPRSGRRRRSPRY